MVEVIITENDGPSLGMCEKSVLCPINREMDEGHEGMNCSFQYLSFVR